MFDTITKALVVGWLALALVHTAVAQEAQPAEQPVEPEYVEPLTEPLAVIPPGHEELFAEMLGRNATLPGECTFTKGQIDRDTVIATYTCAGSAAVVQLRHPGKAPSEATFTDKFALSVQSGSPPPELIEELAKRIREREVAFEWTWLGVSETDPTLRLIAIVVAVLLAGLVLWFVLRRWQRRAQGI